MSTAGNTCIHKTSLAGPGLAPLTCASIASLGVLLINMVRHQPSATSLLRNCPPGPPPHQTGMRFAGPAQPPKINRERIDMNRANIHAAQVPKAPTWSSTQPNRHTLHRAS